MAPGLPADWRPDDAWLDVYDITKAAAEGGTHQELHLSDIKRVIREARKTPVERDTLYRIIERDPVTDQVIESHQPAMTTV